MLYLNAASLHTDVADPVAGDSEYALILQSNVMQLSMGGMDTAPGTCCVWMRVTTSQ